MVELFETHYLFTSSGSTNKIIVIIKSFQVKSAAHESYLLSKNSLVTIDVSKFSQCGATF
jgi:hypothetical protein